MHIFLYIPSRGTRIRPSRVSALRRRLGSMDLLDWGMIKVEVKKRQKRLTNHTLGSRFGL